MRLAAGIAVAVLAALTASAQDKKEVVVDLDGIKAAAPAGWVAGEAKTAFRHAEFKLPKAKGDPRDAELVVFKFEGNAGGADSNIKRWKGQFSPPKGKDIDDVTKISEIKLGGMKASYVDIQGTHNYQDMRDPKAKPEARADSRMLAVYFEGKNNTYTMRLTGPQATVEAHKKAFDDWLKAFK